MGFPKGVVGIYVSTKDVGCDYGIGYNFGVVENVREGYIRRGVEVNSGQKALFILISIAWMSKLVFTLMFLNGMLFLI